MNDDTPIASIADRVEIGPVTFFANPDNVAPIVPAEARLDRFDPSLGELVGATLGFEHAFIAEGSVFDGDIFAPGGLAIVETTVLTEFSWPSDPPAFPLTTTFAQTTEQIVVPAFGTSLGNLITGQSEGLIVPSSEIDLDALTGEGEFTLALRVTGGALGSEIFFTEFNYEVFPTATVTYDYIPANGGGSGGGLPIGGGTGAGLTPEDAQAVALLYEAGLDRDGQIDLPGLNFWIDQREGGLSEEETAQFFLDSDEFAAAFGDPDTLSDRDLVETLYENVLDRPGEPAGVDFWTDAVAAPDFSRADLLFAFATSVENADTLVFIETLSEVSPGEWAFA